MSNGRKELVGKTAIFKESNNKLVSVGSFCSIYRPHKQKLSKLVQYLLQSQSYRNQIKVLLSGSNINNLKPSDIEQKSFKITNNIDIADCVNKLDYFDKIINEFDNQISNSQQLKSVLINQIF
jgi:type I restriction enzyme S subunit